MRARRMPPAMVRPTSIALHGWRCRTRTLRRRLGKLQHASRSARGNDQTSRWRTRDANAPAMSRRWSTIASIRDDAGLRRPVPDAQLSRRVPRHGLPSPGPGGRAVCARCCSTWSPTACRRIPIYRASKATSTTQAKAAWRWTKRLNVPCRSPSVPWRCSDVFAVARTTLLPPILAWCP